MGDAGQDRTGAPARVLVVDDDATICSLVAELLASEGMEARAFTDPVLALDAFGREPFDLAVLDVMMPKMDGFELCTHLLAVRQVPVVFLTAKDAESDLVVGFALGAADYVTKPFKPRELVARVRARLRGAHVGQRPGVLRTRDLEVDPAAHRARLHGAELRLTPKEFAVLVQLARRAGQPVSARELFERTWGQRYDDAAANTVMVHIRRLRAKLAAVDGSQPFIDTVWGVGYKLRDGRGPGAADAGAPGDDVPAGGGSARGGS